ncbi:hypothetical protein BRC96_11240 [Halobacteriales archaeon QS_6_64_34]|nr:MAG: hypothetical protein BRC96_11240 [Halobacteriales archaeon QS_6_64_34]
MEVERAVIRERCTDAVFERGEQYLSEGRVGRLARFGERVTAEVQSAKSDDVTVDFGPEPFESACTCPYDGSGVCKHVVAVLLAVSEDPPEDERPQIEALLDDRSGDSLRSFLLEEFTDDPEMRDRFRARFEAESHSVSAYRDDIDTLFEEATGESSVVTEAIDFSRWFDRAERYRSYGRDREAATVYRAVTESIEENLDRIEGAYGHYERTFQRALDGYVDCLQTAALSDSEFQAAVSVLSERAEAAVGPYSQRYRGAVATLTDDQ